MQGLRSLIRSKMLVGFALLALGLTSLGVQAAPDSGSPADPIMRFLSERTQRAADTAAAIVPEGAPRLIEGVRETASDLILSAMNFLGVRYRYGGSSEETGFDCSGFTRHVFENSIGLLLPRRASEQAEAAGLLNVRKEELKPGDLVFFNTMRRAFSHVGIYVGNGKFIHAPRTGSSIRVDDMSQDYWVNRYDGARRVPQLNGSTETATLR